MSLKRSKLFFVAGIMHREGEICFFFQIYTFLPVISGAIGVGVGVDAGVVGDSCGEVCVSDSLSHSVLCGKKNSFSMNWVVSL